MYKLNKFEKPFTLHNSTQTKSHSHTRTISPHTSAFPPRVHNNVFKIYRFHTWIVYMLHTYEQSNKIVPSFINTTRRHAAVGCQWYNTLIITQWHYSEHIERLDRFVQLTQCWIQFVQARIAIESHVMSLGKKLVRYYCGKIMLQHTTCKIIY